MFHECCMCCIIIKPNASRCWIIETDINAFFKDAISSKQALFKNIMQVPISLSQVCNEAVISFSEFQNGGTLLLA